MTKTLIVLAVFALSTAARASTFIVTDVICRSGAPVNLQETISPGSSGDSASVLDSARSRPIEEMMKDSRELQSILANDRAKQILFASTSTVGYAYRSGAGPCPQDDQVIVIGKIVEYLSAVSGGSKSRQKGDRAERS